MEEITEEGMVAIGGKEWQKGDRRRIYYNRWSELIGLSIERYKSGNIRSAKLDDYYVSNSEGGRLLGSVDGVYWDCTTGQLMIKWGWSTPRELTRDELKERIVSGIKRAIEKL